MTETNEPGSLQRAMFMLLLREGGWWTQREICDELDAEPLEVHARLRNMTDARSLVSRKLDGVRMQYAVTLACTVPAGVSVAELQGAGVTVTVKEAA